MTSMRGRTLTGGPSRECEGFRLSNDGDRSPSQGGQGLGLRVGEGTGLVEIPYVLGLRVGDSIE